MAHARLGPSNHRWPHCPGSVREEAQYPDVSGAAAIDGTGSHLLLEMCLDNNCRADVYDGQIIGANHPDNPMGWLVQPDRIERVQMCLDYITRRHAELTAQYPGATVTVESETRADPGGAFGRDDWWGTVDITITVTDPNCMFIEIIDYKDGRGWVSEKDNSQLISYAFGKARKYVGAGPDLVRPFRSAGVMDGVRMTIVQPKTNPPVRYDDKPTDWLINEAAKLSNAARLTDYPDAPLVPGKHCQWCKANMKRGGHCTAGTEQSLEAIKMFDVTPNPETPADGLVGQLQNLATDLTSLPADKLSQLLDARAALEAAFDRLEAEAERRIETGDNVPGYAMKPGRSTRVWNVDEDELVKAMKGRRLKKDDMYPPKLISPAQFEKLDGLTSDQIEKFMEKYCSTKAGKLKLSKVAHGEEKNPFKDVAIGKTDVQQSEPSTPEVSFL